MVHITVNDTSKEAKAFLEFIKKLPFVKIESEKSPYNPAFVAKIKRAQKEKGRVMKSPTELWESIK